MVYVTVLLEVREKKSNLRQPELRLGENAIIMEDSVGMKTQRSEKIQLSLGYVYYVLTRLRPLACK